MLAGPCVNMPLHYLWNAMLWDESSLTFKMMFYVNIVVTNALWTCQGGHLLKEGSM